MVMSWIWTGIVLISILCALVLGNGSALAAATVSGAQAGIQLALSMAGSLCLWTGAGRLMEHAGITQMLSRLLRPLLHRVFPSTKEDAALVIDQIEGWQNKNLEKFGSRIVYAADEFYLKAEREIPEPECYEDFQQFENGVGMLSLFKSEFYDLLPSIEDREKRKRKISLATGYAAYDLIKLVADEIMKKCPDMDIEVYRIKNDFFGDMITVSGLLTGRDIIGQLKGRELGEYLILPDSLLRNGETVLLDDIYISDIERELGIKIKIALNSADSLVKKIMNTEDI